LHPRRHQPPFTTHDPTVMLPRALRTGPERPDCFGSDVCDLTIVGKLPQEAVPADQRILTRSWIFLQHSSKVEVGEFGQTRFGRTVHVYARIAMVACAGSQAGLVAKLPLGWSAVGSPADRECSLADFSGE
jgi:hypothetical protein